MVRDRSSKSRHCLHFKDGREYGPYTRVGFPKFITETDYYFTATVPSPEAKTAHGSSRSVFVHNGKQYEPVPKGEVVVSPDGKRLAYVLQLPTKGSSLGKLTTVAVIDGWQSQPYKMVGLPVFSPDSRHVAFYAHKRGRDLVVIDGREGPPEEEIQRFSGKGKKDSRKLLFSPDSQHLWYIARRQNKYCLIRNAKDVMRRWTLMGPPCVSPTFPIRLKNVRKSLFYRPEMAKVGTTSL
ncbi:MAG: PD40 domain-containing protein [Sedimentisphaerales bacterium]|nr:PD40 domain-containing protein [Sedimentisphaerales bacterium]